MSRSTNDAIMLQRYSLCYLPYHDRLFDRNLGIEGFLLYLLGDLGLSLLPWLMVPHCSLNPAILETVYNQNMCRGRYVVEMSLVYLKKTRRKFLDKSDMNVKNVPDVIVGCDIPHNVLPSQGKNDVQLLDIINNHETGEGELDDDEGKSVS